MENLSLCLTKWNQVINHTICIILENKNCMVNETVGGVLHTQLTNCSAMAAMLILVREVNLIQFYISAKTL